MGNDTFKTFVGGITTIVTVGIILAYFLSGLDSIFKRISTV